MQQQPPTPPQQPVIGQVPPPHRIVVGEPHLMYEGFRNQRRELADQLDRLEDQRENLSQQLQQPVINDADKKGLEQRIAQIDARIADVDKALADADANVARSAAVPGAVVPPPPEIQTGPPEEFWVLSGIFLFVVGLPLTIAYARRIWRRSAAAVTKLPQEIYDRFARVDQSLDAIAVEVERIGEGQRFLTRIYTEQQRALSAGQAERLEISERERDRQRRGS
jgi:hypothetical protein